ADLPIYRVSTMQQRIDESLWSRAAASWSFAIFAGVAMMLAISGIYGVVSYAVGQRTHEIGIRMALGAQSRDIFRLVIGQGMLLTGIGVGLGLLLAFPLGQMLSGMLLGVNPADPVLFATVAAFLTGVALLACYIPARRATRVDPLVALRYE
ncbi:MAG: FtsX-like permease family protein, partial [Candidatus Acidiferrales bacterium]